MHTKKLAIKTAAFFALLYLLYAGISYTYLPHKLKEIVEHDISATIGREITLESFAFNPFTLTLRCNNLTISDTPHAPILQFQSLSVNLSFWHSLFKLYPVIDAIAWQAPQVQIRKEPDGFNFARILDRLATPSKNETTGPGTADSDRTVRLLIKHIRVQSGTASYYDTTQTVTADAQLNTINIALDNLYIATGADNNNPFSIATQIRQGGHLEVTGQYRLQPLYVNSRVTLTDVALTEVSDFLRNFINADLSGQLNGHSQMILQQQPGHPLALDVKNTRLTIKDLVLDDSAPGPEALRIRKLLAQGIAFNLHQQRLFIDRLIYDGIAIHQWRDSSGQWRYQSLLKERAATDSNTEAVRSTTAGANREKAPWHIDVNTLAVTSGRISVTDQAVNPPGQWNLSDIALELAPLHLNSGEAGQLQAEARLNGETSLSLQGEFVVAPFSIQSSYSITHFLLDSLNPYLATTSYAQLQQGTLSSSGQIALTATPGFSLTTEGDAELTDFDLINRRTQSDILSFDALKLHKARLKLPEQLILIDRIGLLEPKLILENRQQANWDLLKPSRKTANSEAEAAPSDPFHFALQNFIINDGQIHFEDASLEPGLRTSINNLELSARNIDTRPEQSGSAQLSAKINHQATLKTRADFTLSTPSAEFNGQLQSLDLRHFSPYTAALLGFNTQSGLLNYDFSYQLENTSVKGRNQILAENFYLGDKMPGEAAINLPVKLGMSLLRDFNGNIPLDLAISGDITAPDFSLIGLLSKAFANVLVKVAASPFTMLGSLLNSEQDLSSVTFEPGSAVLTDQAQNTLQALAKALTQKPELTLVLQGNASPGKDAQVLAQQALIKRITPQQSPGESTLADWQQDNRTALIKAFNQRGQGSFQDLLNHYQENADNNTAQAQALARAFDLLVQDTEADNTALVAMANERAQTIKGFLLEKELAPGQLVVQPATTDNLTGTGIAFTLQAH